MDTQEIEINLLSNDELDVATGGCIPIAYEVKCPVGNLLVYYAIRSEEHTSELQSRP